MNPSLGCSSRAKLKLYNREELAAITMSYRSLAALPWLVGTCAAAVYNTFDGEGFPSCYNVTEVHNATSIENIVSIVKNAVENGVRVRAAGKVHTLLDTQYKKL